MIDPVINAEAPCLVLADLSDYAGNATKLTKILLNGNNICMVRRPLTSFDFDKNRWKCGPTTDPTTTSQLIPGGEGPVQS